MSLIRLQGEAEKRKRVFYQLDSAEEPIGVGGMGQVFKGLCVDERTGATRPVAIKFMYEDLPANAIERARREASIQLRNDNLVEMLGFIETEERDALGGVKKHYHVVSELLTGVSLSDILDGKTVDRTGEEVPYAVKLLQDYKNDPEHFARVIVMNILSGLMALHDAGYIHRDIDPSNIMVTSDDHIKLIDFGIAKQMNSLTTNDKSLTVAGKFMGKPEYAAPELALGDIKHQNQTTDIYAMGILLYQCIVGHTPFEGARHEILEKQLKAKMPLNVIKNKNLRRIIAIACEKKQDLRYQTSAQMRVALETMNAGKKPISSQLKYTMIAAVVGLVIILGGALLLFNKERENKRHEAEMARYEQQKVEFASSLKSLSDEAGQLLEAGKDTEADNYEQALMKAYTAYENIGKKAQQAKMYEVTLPDVDVKKREIIMLLTTALNQFGVQTKELEDLDMPDLAASYKKRQLEVQDFLTKVEQQKKQSQMSKTLENIKKKERK